MSEYVVFLIESSDSEAEETNRNVVEKKKVDKPSKDKPAEKKESDDEVINPLMTGFEMGYIPEKIIGITTQDGKLLFLVQWKGKRKAQLVDSKIVRKECPDLVIDYYESRLTWNQD